MEKTEARIQQEIVLWVNNNFPKLRLKFFHVPNGGNRSIKEAVKFKAMGVLSGVPDLLCPFPMIKSNNLYYANFCCEVKTDTGALSKQQLKIKEDWEAAGAFWCMARSLEDFQSSFWFYFKDSTYIEGSKLIEDYGKEENNKEQSSSKKENTHRWMGKGIC